MSESPKLYLFLGPPGAGEYDLMKDLQALHPDKTALVAAGVAKTAAWKQDHPEYDLFKRHENTVAAFRNDGSKPEKDNAIDKLATELLDEALGKKPRYVFLEGLGSTRKRLDRLNKILSLHQTKLHAFVHISLSLEEALKGLEDRPQSLREIASSHQGSSIEQKLRHRYNVYENETVPMILQQQTHHNRTVYELDGSVPYEELKAQAAGVIFDAGLLYAQ